MSFHCLVIVHYVTTLGLKPMDSCSVSYGKCSSIIKGKFGRCQRTTHYDDVANLMQVFHGKLEKLVKVKL